MKSIWVKFPKLWCFYIAFIVDASSTEFELAECDLWLVFIFSGSHLLHIKQIRGSNILSQNIYSALNYCSWNISHVKNVANDQINQYDQDHQFFILYIVINGDYADLVTFTEEILNGKLHFLCSATSQSTEDFYKFYSPM